MKLKTLLLILPLIATACAGSPDRRGPPGGPGGEGGNRNGRAMDYASAAALVDQGEYSRALPVLRCLADRGDGYEIAQYLAGHATIALSEQESTPDILQPELYLEGIDRLDIAARAGWPSAQARLAELYWRAGSEDGLSNAAYWSAVYRNNARDRALGVDRLSDHIEREIQSALDADANAAITQSALAFTPEPMPQRETSPECAQLLASGQRMGRSREGQSGRGNRQGRGGGGGRGGGRPYLVSE